MFNCSVVQQAPLGGRGGHANRLNDHSGRTGRCTTVCGRGFVLRARIVVTKTKGKAGLCVGRRSWLLSEEQEGAKACRHGVVGA